MTSRRLDILSTLIMGAIYIAGLVAVGILWASMVGK
jgi:hypothetical protein